MISRLTIALLLVAVPAAAQTNGSSDSLKSTSTGIYSEEQAEAGKNAFASFCASCHSPGDYSGEQFRMNWYGRRVSDLFRTLKTTMPEDNIGGLSDAEYTRVITYIFKLNGFPAGKDSLPADSTVLRQYRIGPDSVKAPGGE